MNRRSFITRLGTVALGFSILPSAMTYQRTWKATESGVLVMDCNVIAPPARVLAWWWCKQINSNFIMDIGEKVPMDAQSHGLVFGQSNGDPREKFNLT